MYTPPITEIILNTGRIMEFSGHSSEADYEEVLPLLENGGWIPKSLGFSVRVTWVESGGAFFSLHRDTEWISASALVWSPEGNDLWNELERKYYNLTDLDLPQQLTTWTEIPECPDRIPCLATFLYPSFLFLPVDYARWILNFQRVFAEGVLTMVDA